MELVQKFVEKKLQQQGQTLEMVENCAWESSKISHFLVLFLLFFCFSFFFYAFFDILLMFHFFVVFFSFFLLAA